MGRGEGRALGDSSGRVGSTNGPGELPATETAVYILEAASEALRQLRSAQQQADRLVRQALELLASTGEVSSRPAVGPPRDPLLSLAEVAQILSIGRREVSQLVRDKVIPSVRLSGRIFVPRKWLDDRGEEEMDGLGLA
jgi:excisionase family DNA binding protein